MKTYFIKDDETKTAEDYFRNSKFAKYFNGTSTFRLQDMISDVNGKSFQEVLAQLNKLDDDYLTNISMIFFDPFYGFESALNYTLKLAYHNGDTKIREQIIQKTNQLKFVSGCTELRNAADSAMAALNDYKNSIKAIIRKFDKLM